MSTEHVVTNGGAHLYFWDTHRKRILDAFGPAVVKVLEDFVNVPVDASGFPAAWTSTVVQAGAGSTTFALVGGATGGAGLITTDNADNDGLNMQLKGEAFKLVAGSRCYFGINFSISDATQSDFLVGLAITDTDALGGLTDGAYFRKVDGATAVTCVIEKDSLETASATILTMDTGTHTLEFWFDGSGTVTPYVDGVASTALSGANLPDDEFLTPTIHFLTGEAVAKTMQINWARWVQLN